MKSAFGQFAAEAEDALRAVASINVSPLPASECSQETADSGDYIEYATEDDRQKIEAAVLHGGTFDSFQSHHRRGTHTTVSDATSRASPSEISAPPSPAHDKEGLVPSGADDDVTPPRDAQTKKGHAGARRRLSIPHAAKLGASPGETRSGKRQSSIPGCHPFLRRRSASFVVVPGQADAESDGKGENAAAAAALEISRRAKERQGKARNSKSSKEDEMPSAEETEQVAQEPEPESDRIDDVLTSAHKLLWEAAHGSQLCLSLTEGSFEGWSANCLEVEVPASLVLDMFSTVHYPYAPDNATGAFAGLQMQQQAGVTELAHEPNYAHNPAAGMAASARSSYSYEGSSVMPGFLGWCSGAQFAAHPIALPDEVGDVSGRQAVDRRRAQHLATGEMIRQMAPSPIGRASGGSNTLPLHGNANGGGSSKGCSSPDTTQPPFEGARRSVRSSLTSRTSGESTAKRDGSNVLNIPHPPANARRSSGSKRRPHMDGTKPKQDAQPPMAPTQDGADPSSACGETSARSSSAKGSKQASALGSSPSPSKQTPEVAALPQQKLEDLYIYTAAPRGSSALDGEMENMAFAHDLLGESVPPSRQSRSSNLGASLRLGSAPHAKHGRSARLLASLEPVATKSVRYSHAGPSGALSARWPPAESALADPVVLGGRRKPGTAPAGASRENREPWVDLDIANQHRILNPNASYKSILAPSISSKSFGVRSVASGSSTACGDPLAQRPHTSPEKGASPGMVRDARWRRARERQWDSRFTKTDSTDSPGGGSSASGRLIEFGPQSFGGAHELALERRRVEEMAAMCTGHPSTPSVPSRPLTREKPRQGQQAQVLLNMSLAGYDVWKTEIKRENPEWYGSMLHSAYSHSVDAINLRRPVDAPRENDPSEAHELMETVVSKTHTRLRELVSYKGNFGHMQPQEAIAECRVLVQPLLEEAQLPPSVEHQVIDANGEPEDGDDDWSPRRYMQHQIACFVEAARAILAYRDAAACVIHGLTQHERLLGLLKKEREMAASQSAQRNDEVELDPRSLQLSRIDSALLRGIEVWRRRYPAEWLTDPTERPATSHQRIFVWRGLDAVERLRGDAVCARLPPLNVATSVSSLVSASSSLCAEAFSVYDFAEHTEPQNAAARAALGGARGLRALLRSGQLKTSRRPLGSREGGRPQPT